MFVTNAMQLFSTVWMELLVAGLVALSYFITKPLSKNGPSRPKKASPKTVLTDRPLQSCDSPSRRPSSQSYDSTEPASMSQIATQALRAGKIKDAIALVMQLPGTAAGRVPANVSFRLLSAASKMTNCEDAVSELAVLKGKIGSGPLEAVIADAWKNGNAAACRRLHQISNVLAISKSHQTFQTLASAYSFDATALRKLVREAGTPLPMPLVKTVLDACAVMKDDDLAEEVLHKVSTADAVMLREARQCSPVSRMTYDSLAKTASTSAASASTSAGKSDCSSPRQSSAGDDVTPSVSAVDLGSIESNCRPPDTAKIAMRANDIRSCGRNGDITGALKVFERLDPHIADSTLVLNSTIDACVSCRDLDKAMEIFNRAKLRGLADTITYNTMIKGYIASGQEGAAKQLLEELSQKGLAATRPSYHGLLNSRINAGDYRGAWKLIADMQLAAVSPNAVTCSIMLKGRPQSVHEISKVLALVEAMDQPMDDVLFHSVAEACIRGKRLDVLARQTARFTQQGQGSGLTAPTYGSMIKAFGNAHDTKQVWSLWNQMISHNVLPTSVTLGCMVEALVNNGLAADAWQLASKMWNDQRTKPCVNTVIYSSILKGFASSKETDKLMAVYEEMRARQVQPNTITFNTIFNAFAQNGQMHRVPTLLEHMRTGSPPVRPDIVTYSTIVKGFCNAGNLDRAIAVVKDMESDGRCKPDEVMYNSLLSGCAKEFRLDGALQLLRDMRKSGIAPSNYTLSMLVKLMGRCKRINEAFAILDDISKEYGLKINIQVYTCLITGCFNNGETNKAIALHDKIIEEGLLPDAMTYTVLVKGCLQAGLVDKAVDLARCAYGRGSVSPCSRGSPPGLSPGSLDEVIAALGNLTGSESAKELMNELRTCRASSANKVNTQRTW